MQEKHTNSISLDLQIERNKILSKVTLFALLYSVIGLIATYILGIYHWNALESFALLIIPFSVCITLELFVFIYTSIQSKVLKEKEEKILLQKRKNKSAFDLTDEVRFSMKNTLLKFDKYAPFITALTGSFICIPLIFFINKLNSTSVFSKIENPLNILFVVSLFILISLFFGAFCVGQSREQEFRLLRPIGAWLFFSALIATLTAGSAIFYKFELFLYCKYITNIILILYLILGLEFIVNFISEFYRPRHSQSKQTPLFESRLLALFVEPGGFVKNIANTLDYQFGFSISKTSIYGFIEKSLIPLVIVWLLILWLFTSIDEVKSHEIGVRERFGKVIFDDNEKIAIEPGFVLKFPWPIEKIVKYPISRIQEIVIGPELTGEDGIETRPSVVLWTKSHYAKDASYLVASKNSNSKTNSTSISFISASFPVQYKIRKDELYNFAYLHQNAHKTFKYLSNRIITKYLASIDMIKFMSHGRKDASQELQKQIQIEADKLHLGIDVTCVNLHDAHPPIQRVAPAFQKIIQAKEKREIEILKAKKYDIETKAEAHIIATATILTSKAESANKIKIAEAESIRFNKQYMAYKAMPKLFTLKQKFNFLTNDCKDIRKYIISDSIDYEVYEIDLKENTRLDLLDMDFK